jgi:small subunit ribosomal protein S16
MPVALRLMRFGKKDFPTYRIVALDKRQKRDGQYIEKVGTYNPMTEPATLELSEDRLKYWLTTGAVVSEGLRKLLKNRLPKKAEAKAAKTEEAPKKEATAKKAATSKKAAAKKATKKTA